VLLRYFEDFPLEARAETLTLPMGTVKSRLNAAKAKLARRLAGRIER
jgi:DNA-directed RNA polymerase specialized sigma24 family protein